MRNGGFKQHHAVLRHVLGGLRQGVGRVFGCDFNASGVHQLGKLANLKAAIGQHGQKLVVVVGIGVGGFAGVIELGRATECQLEAGFGEVAGGHV